SITAGATYYIEAAGAGSSAGAYTLTLAPVVDDFPNDFNHAFPIPLGADDTATQPGTIDLPGDADVFTFTASATGPLVIRQERAPGSTVDSNLSVYDSRQVFLQSSDNGGGGKDSQVTLQAVASQTYYLRALSNNSTTGRYNLVFAP